MIVRRQNLKPMKEKKAESKGKVSTLSFMNDAQNKAVLCEYGMKGRAQYLQNVCSKTVRLFSAVFANTNEKAMTVL